MVVKVVSTIRNALWSPPDLLIQKFYFEGFVKISRENLTPCMPNYIGLGDITILL